MNFIEDEELLEHLAIGFYIQEHFGSFELRCFGPTHSCESCEYGDDDAEECMLDITLTEEQRKRYPELLI